MPELWRILPARGESPILFTTRYQLDKSILFCQRISEDRNESATRRAAARAVASGQVQVASHVEWVDSE